MARVRVNSAVLYTTTKGMGGPSPLVDGAGNTFIAIKEGNGDVWVGYVRKTSPSGAVLGEWEVAAGNDWKMDDCALSASGTSLLIASSAHDISRQHDPRPSNLALATIPGVFAPFGDHLAGAGAAGAFMPTGGDPNPDPNPGGGDVVDYEKIQKIAEAAAQGVIDTFGDKGDVRLALKNKAADAILYMYDPANVEAEAKVKRFQDVTFNQLAERLYYALIKHLAGGKKDAEGKQVIPNDSADYDAHLKALVNAVLDEREKKQPKK